MKRNRGVDGTFQRVGKDKGQNPDQIYLPVSMRCGSFLLSYYQFSNHHHLMIIIISCVMNIDGLDDV